MFDKRAYQVIQEFDSDKQWSLKITSKKFYEISGYSPNAGFKGSGRSLEKAWKDVIYKCNEKIEDCERIKKEAQEQIDI